MKKTASIIFILVFLLATCLIPLAAEGKIIKTTNTTNISGVLKPNHIIKMENVSIFSEITKGKFSAAKHDGLAKGQAPQKLHKDLRTKMQKKPKEKIPVLIQLEKKEDPTASPGSSIQRRGMSQVNTKWET